MTLQERSPKEIKAYIDGYNACYKKFCEELERESVERAKAVMECMVYAVNSTGDMKGESNGK